MWEAVGNILRSKMYTLASLMACFRWIPWPNGMTGWAMHLVPMFLPLLVRLCLVFSRNILPSIFKMGCIVFVNRCTASIAKAASYCNIKTYGTSWLLLNTSIETFRDGNRTNYSRTHRSRRIRHIVFVFRFTCFFFLTFNLQGMLL